MYQTYGINFSCLWSESWHTSLQIVICAAGLGTLLQQLHLSNLRNYIGNVYVCNAVFFVFQGLKFVYTILALIKESLVMPFSFDIGCTYLLSSYFHFVHRKFCENSSSLFKMGFCKMQKHPFESRISRLLYGKGACLRIVMEYFGLIC